MSLRVVTLKTMITTLKNAGDFASATSESTLLIDFWAPWCPPCRLMEPILDQFATQMEGKVDVLKVNVDEFPDLSTRFNIMSIPTILVVKEGKFDTRIVGVASLDTLLTAVGE